MVTFVVNEPAVLENTATKKQHSLKSNNVTDLSGKCVIFFINFVLMPINVGQFSPAILV